MPPAVKVSSSYRLPKPYSRLSRTTVVAPQTRFRSLSPEVPDSLLSAFGFEDLDRIQLALPLPLDPTAIFTHGSPPTPAALQASYKRLKTEKSTLLARLDVLNEGWMNSPHAIEPSIFLEVQYLEAQVAQLVQGRSALGTSRDALEHEKEVQHTRNTSLMNRNISLQSDVEKAVGTLRSLAHDLRSSAA